ncbi:hypothetical protein AB434_2441 [Heyndrickxia coagulans]|uniref:Uncharacterized protein n=2 Tax=Heyndrickxia coagulans TaxID=1398 RepID=G2TML4_HEYCO|nr:hypothetical protein Bcoa_0282 [Heyndrickxia coagulans 36D1]AJO23658.1 hypothetical protein SB48_HM08orf04565 [Heyndrickxia coagulans]AKN54846.1 hypothetical protein AB434_2441 [Heyndrickxia coagulans]KYC63205.1 hypothetical protein B4100_0366 [Heyndrickxia coagulans]KYC88625.1 hypothetical protein B4096_0217 [Heyndrickxia coagulans]
MTMSIRHFNVAIAALFAAFALHAMPAKPSIKYRYFQLI